MTSKPPLAPIVYAVAGSRTELPAIVQRPKTQRLQIIFPAGPRSRLRPLLARLALLLIAALQPGTFAAAQQQTSAHTDPINLLPEVREAHDHFYNLDYDGALSRFEAIDRAHPNDPLARAYVLQVLIFRELYHQDLLDTTYYAHDSFLTSKRKVDVPDDIRQRIETLTDQVTDLCDRQIKADSTDKNAFFARGYARGLHASFVTLVDHSFVSAAHQGLQARNDSEQTLRIDPDYTDAKMSIGIQQFAVASLPRVVRLMVGIAGVGGNKEKGLDLLRDVGAHGLVNNVEARTVLSLFLRHDARYAEALTVQGTLARQYPRDYLFRLEEANLSKDKGDGPAAIAIYRKVIDDARKPNFFIDPRLQMAFFGLAETARGQNDFNTAAANYLAAAAQPHCSDWLRKRAQLNAGEMFDLLHQRDKAIAQYQLAAAAGGDQSQADQARKYLKSPYTGG